MRVNKMNMEELRELAKDSCVKGVNKMNIEELRQALIEDGFDDYDDNAQYFEEKTEIEQYEFDNSLVRFNEETGLYEVVSID